MYQKLVAPVVQLLLACVSQQQRTGHTPGALKMVGTVGGRGGGGTCLFDHHFQINLRWVSTLSSHSVSKFVLANPAAFICVEQAKRFFAILDEGVPNVPRDGFSL
jgi:hypothetical protein